MQLPDFSVKGRVALFTGAGRGIGLAIARALAAGGAAVAIQDIDRDVAQGEVDGINAAGGRAIALGGDLTDVSLAEALVEQVTQGLGAIDILVNNGSTQHWDEFTNHSVERMRRELESNVLMPTRLCQLLLPAMKQRKWGRVINFSSIQEKSGNTSLPAYAMSRAAMTNLTRGLAREYGRDGITVNCIAPGWIDTQRTADGFKDEQDKLEKGRRLPGGRIGRPDDFPGLGLLLCSRAGDYINGQTIFVDGGMSI